MFYRVMQLLGVVAVITAIIFVPYCFMVWTEGPVMAFDNEGRNDIATWAVGLISLVGWLAMIAGGIALLLWIIFGDGVFE